MMSGMQEESTETREKNEVAVPVKGTGVIRKETAPVEGPGRKRRIVCRCFSKYDCGYDQEGK